MYRSALTFPIFGFLLAATTVSHAASFCGDGFSGASPAGYGSSGALTIAGGGSSIHDSGVVNWGGLSLSGNGTLVLSSANTYTGNVILSAGSLSGSFNESLGSLTISSGTIPLTGNSSTTDWGAWSHLTWTGGGILWLEGNQLELSSISFIDPNSLSGGSLSAVQLQNPNPAITGWTLIPEPSGTMLSIVGGICLLMSRRSRGTALPDGARSA